MLRPRLHDDASRSPGKNRSSYPFTSPPRLSHMRSELQSTTQRSWNRFLATYEPLRTELYRYCRHLTRSPWDAEDLAQDTLARAFVTLAQMSDEAQNPRAWLFRVASNLWIDQMRRRRETAVAVPEMPAPAASDERAPREAAGTLLVKLSPQERAAVVLKDAFDCSLEEVSEALGTTVGSVKAALHRARGKLAESSELEPEVQPVPGALDAFCTAFNAGDLDALASLLLDSAVVEVVGATTQYGPEAARRTVLYGMLFGSRLLADPHSGIGIDLRYRQGVLPDLPRVEARFHRDRWVLVHWYKHEGGEAVRAFTTVELEGERIARARNYFYNPELLTDLAGELGVPIRINGRRWWRDDASRSEPASTESR
jgi:RNA polymerase sigma-70 factor, ECF subfamily